MITEMLSPWFLLIQTCNQVLFYSIRRKGSAYRSCFVVICSQSDVSRVVKLPSYGHSFRAGNIELSTPGWLVLQVVDI